MRTGHDSVWGALEVLRERWAFLVLREAFFGVHRFGEMQRNLAIAKNILSDRLSKLVSEGVLQRCQYQERPRLFEYRLTQKGLDLYPTILALMAWGDRWVAEEGNEPITLRHKVCGSTFRARVTCSKCGEPVHARDVGYEHGPGMSAHLTMKEEGGGSGGTLPIRPLVEPDPDD